MQKVCGSKLKIITDHCFGWQIFVVLPWGLQIKKILQCTGIMKKEKQRRIYMKWTAPIKIQKIIISNLWNLVQVTRELLTKCQVLAILHLKYDTIIMLSSNFIFGRQVFIYTL